MTLAEYKKKYNTKRDIRVNVNRITYWDDTINNTITKFKEIKKEHKGKEIRVEIDEDYNYGDQLTVLRFYFWRKETKEEFDKRMQIAYSGYVKNEERDIETYKRMKEKFEG